MSNVEAKAKELIRDLSARTGVAEHDVKKILDTLGLSGALQNREAAKDGPPLAGVRVENLRAAAGGGVL
jgi:hypothetical protein